MHHIRRFAGVCSSVLVAGVAVATATAPGAQARPCSQNLATARAVFALCGGGGVGGGGGGGGGGGISGGGGGGGTVDPPPPAPRYALEAVWFQCVDETGETSVGSDEDRFTFDATDAQGVRTHTSQYFDDVDTGESYDFNSSTRTLSPAGGSMAPLSLATTVMEIDTWPDYDDTIGHSDTTFSAADLQASVPDVGTSTVRTLTFNGDMSNYVVYLTITRVA